VTPSGAKYVDASKYPFEESRGRSVGKFRSVLILLALAGTFLSAQTVTTPQSDASAQPKVSVYIYRYKQFVGSALQPSVYCDEVQLARMENGRYFAVKLEPGKHTFRSNDQQSGVELDLKAGQEYFLRVEIATGMLKGHGRLVLTAPEQGRFEVKAGLKPLDQGKVVDKTRVSVEQAKFDTPLPAPAKTATTTQQQAQPLPQEPAVREVVLSDTAAPADPQTSLGDAARTARQKKQAASNSAVSNPQ
jgi:hypothetical protein